MPRPAFLVVASLVSATSHFILAVSTSEVAFTLGVTLSGVAFGMVWPMMYVCLLFFVNIMRDHNPRVYSFVILISLFLPISMIQSHTLNRFLGF